jgi:undecaprenyl phosphate-alpha-L-ara4N flippase subunit ArnE
MLRSLYQKRFGIALMAISALFVATGQLFWKLGAKQGLFFLSIGFVLYGLGAIILIIAFRFGDVSVLHPFLSLSYVFALYFGYTVLSEEISLNRGIGVFAIILGVTLIGSTSND